MFLNGVSPGTRPANHMASTFENEPSGSVSLIVISPVLSSVSMPEMSPSALPCVDVLLRALDDEVEGAPPDSRLRTRLIVCSKSEALTGEPSEYFRPSRSVIS